MAEKDAAPLHPEVEKILRRLANARGDLEKAISRGHRDSVEELLSDYRRDHLLLQKWQRDGKARGWQAQDFASVGEALNLGVEAMGKAAMALSPAVLR
jgi:hypothetical protein